MVTVAQSERMRRFVGDRLAQSGYVVCQEKDWGMVVASPLEQAVVFLHTGRQSHARMESRRARAVAYRYPHAHVVYGDGSRTGLVRLAWRGNRKLQRSLHRYEKRDVDRMIWLRLREKDLRMDSGITYYRPESARLPERLEQVAFAPVYVTYSRLERGMHGYGFARDGMSTDFALTRTVWRVADGGVMLVPAGLRREFTPAADSPMP